MKTRLITKEVLTTKDIEKLTLCLREILKTDLTPSIKKAGEETFILFDQAQTQYLFMEDIKMKTNKTYQEVRQQQINKILPHKRNDKSLVQEALNMEVY